MPLYRLLITAVALAMDAFAVSIGTGVALYRVTGKHTLRVAIWFGAFQAGMPVIGWLAGSTLRTYVRSWDHWVAFGLLTFLGVKMVWDSRQREETDNMHHIKSA